MSVEHYPHLFRPVQLGAVHLSHRAIMGSMHTGLEEEWGGYRRLAAFYVERIRGGIELIVTGGVSPNFRGRLGWNTSQLSSHFQLAKHRQLTASVHAAGGHICMQLLHAGRYAMHPFAVAPSAIKAPISPITPTALSSRKVRKTIDDFIHAASLAQQAGYDGVEIMGSEGYLINQFVCAHTNQRDDEWGGTFEKRMRFAVEIVRGTRAQLGDAFIIIFRLSMLDLLEKGSTWHEVVVLAKAIEQAGASAINTGIGWHEVRIPTIAASVPPAAFTWVTEKLSKQVSIPLIASNRINSPDVAEQVLASGQATMISMARPMLADAEFINKAKQGEGDAINTCIACNQGCLDHVFKKQRASCLVNPRACYETELVYTKTLQPKKVAVIGLGPAGLMCAGVAAQRGHHVVAYDAAKQPGGQFNLACKIPGKQEFHETLRYLMHQLHAYGVQINTQTTITQEHIASLCDKFDIVVLSTGVVPRTPSIPGIEHSCVMNYVDAIYAQHTIGKRVAIIGAGGIGFDVAIMLLENSQTSPPQATQRWFDEWGVDKHYQHAGGVKPAYVAPPVHDITLLQRKHSKPGKTLGKTTGWIHRMTLRKAGVKMLSGVEYSHIDDAGLHIQRDGKSQLLAVDTIVTCAGQLSNQTLLTQLQQHDVELHVIGGALKAAELDAETAIRQGAELAASL